ncbi:MAG: S49 family peptidase [bacterium]|nr:S49 family peptidase [bacterium]
MFREHSFLSSLLMTAGKVIVTFFSLAWCFFILGLVAGLVVSLGDETEAEIASQYHYGQRFSENKLLSIPISGVILGDRLETDPSNFLIASSITYGYEVKEQLYEAAEDESYKGVILEINSPGGTIFGSQAIVDGVNYYKEKTGKPVISYVGGMAASGGYWAAVSGDSIYADVGTATGSIGVLFGPFKYYDQVISEDGGLLAGGVVTENGIKTVTFTAGKAKDFGNPYRQMSQEEMEHTQKVVDNEYDRFVKLVSQRRTISDATLREDIGAFLYDPVSAKEKNLIDDVLNREQAYQELANRADVGDFFQVVQAEPELGFWGQLLSSQSILQPLSRANESTPAVSPLCAHTSLVLAYHGDVPSLCL